MATAASPRLHPTSAHIVSWVSRVVSADLPATCISLCVARVVDVVKFVWTIRVRSLASSSPRAAASLPARSCLVSPSAASACLSPTCISQCVAISFGLQFVSARRVPWIPRAPRLVVAPSLVAVNPLDFAAVADSTRIKSPATAILFPLVLARQVRVEFR